MLSIVATDKVEEKPPLLMVPVCGDALLHKDRKLSALVRSALKLEEFSGEKKQCVVFYQPRGINAERVLLVGLGKVAAVVAEDLRVAASLAVRKAMEGGLSRLHVAVPEEGKINMPHARVLTALGEGGCLANQVTGAYKKDEKIRPLAHLVLVTAEAVDKDTLVLARTVEAVCDATCLARTWVNMPSNLKPPAALADLIAAQARKEGLNVTVLDEKALAKKGFGALLAVGGGSANPPRLLVLAHAGARSRKKTVLVGKGVTFDTGGINLKPGNGLETMKTDMAGAAAVAATLICAARLKLKKNLVGVMPLAENMPSGGALRPGDVVTGFSGKTIEVGNTDAEGRLILSDAMAWAEKTHAPEVMVDLATLTGACVVALGEKIAGVFSTDVALTDAIVAAGRRTGERCWPMPMPEDYKELLKSELADINNMSNTRYGGAITAALFLSEFAGNARWAHIDIAGPARNAKAVDGCPAGGSGFGVRLLWELLGSL